jgi:hypothetical protein
MRCNTLCTSFQILWFFLSEFKGPRNGGFIFFIVKALELEAVLGWAWRNSQGLALDGLWLLPACHRSIFVTTTWVMWTVYGAQMYAVPNSKEQITQYGNDLIRDPTEIRRCKVPTGQHGVQKKW